MIRIDFKIPEDNYGAKLFLYRSTVKLTDPNIDKVRYPVAEFLINSEKKFCNILQAKATFYKAIDINYPNTLDRIRCDFLRTEGLVPEGRGIGGEIQIHGQHARWGSIQRNWTWGCISLRNTDMDEIFDLSTFKVGIPLVIFGYEFSLEDLMSLNEERPLDMIKPAQEKLSKIGVYKGSIDGIIGRQTQLAIGRFQKDQGLPISCVLDSRTVERLLNIPR